VSSQEFSRVIWQCLVNLQNAYVIYIVSGTSQHMLSKRWITKFRWGLGSNLHRRTPLPDLFLVGVSLASDPLWQLACCGMSMLIIFEKSRSCVSSRGCRRIPVHHLYLWDLIRLRWNHDVINWHNIWVIVFDALFEVSPAGSR